MKTCIAVFIVGLIYSASYAEEVKIGILLGYTGPIESLVPAMSAAAETALQEASDSGVFLSGATIKAYKADSTCLDTTAATAAAERLVSAHSVSAIIGAGCSGTTMAILRNVAIPKNITMISSGATSPALSQIEDNGLFFRSVASDARQGQVLADAITNRGITSIALTYTNNDYGKGFADSVETRLKANGGKVIISLPHEDGKGDYSAEVATLAQADAQALLIIGYIDQGGKAILQSAVDSGGFKKFILPSDMIQEHLRKNLSVNLNGSFGTIAGGKNIGRPYLQKIAKRFKADASYAAESYDAGALMVLAMQAANSAHDFKHKVFEVANSSGVKIYPGELAKGLKLISEGIDIDYEGATTIELIGAGEPAGKFIEIEIVQGKNRIVKYH